MLIVAFIFMMLCIVTLGKIQIRLSFQEAEVRDSYRPLFLFLKGYLLRKGR